MTDALEPLSTDPNAYVFVDVETRSRENVKAHGAYRHTAAGRVTIFTYGIGDGEIRDWVLEDWTPGRKLDWADAPDDLKVALRRVQAGKAWIVAHNAGFEYNAFTRAMRGLEDFRVEWMIDSMVQAMRSHLPSDLAGAAKAIGLTQKQANGKALIKMFADASRPETPASHPEDWARFRAYARDDVAAMRDVFMATMPLSRRMWEEYWASERINHRGVPVDLPFVRGAAALAKRLTETANDDIQRLTGGKIKTVNQNKALLDWIRYTLRHLPEVDRLLTSEFNIEDEDGERVSVPKYSLGRGLVEALIAHLEKLDDEQGLTDDEWAVLQVLEVRLYGASATPKKYQKILDNVDADGRLKGQYVFCGAPATTRFSSKGVQIHNLARDTVGSLDDEIDAIELITEKGADAYDEIKARWGYVGKVLSRLVRPVFIAEEGYTLIFVDWSSIQAIICPWVTGDEDVEPLLTAIRANHADPSLPDMYKVQASKILGKPPHDIDKKERQAYGKTVQLGFQFLGGENSLHAMGRIYRVHFEDDEATRIKDLWRSENKWAVRFGDKVWEGVLWCMENPGLPREVGLLTFVYDAEYRGGSLFCVLPNGDPLIYTGIRWREVTIKDKQTGEEKVETRLTVWKGRGVAPIWKGEFVNNFVQGFEAAMLRHCLRKLDEIGWPVVVASTHDEIIVQVEKGREDEAEKVMLDVMCRDIPGAEGLPIKAEATRWDWYTKVWG